MASPQRTKEPEQLERSEEWRSKLMLRPGVIHRHNPSPVPFKATIKVNLGVDVLELLGRDESDEDSSP